MAQLVSLSQMNATIRRMTARYSPQQLSDSQINNYINLFYTLHFPEEFKNIKLTKPYVFLTIPNVDTYPFVYESGLVNDPAGNPIPGNVQLTPPVYCQGYQLRYFQDKNSFYNRWPKLSVNQQIGTGNGTAGPYTGTIPTSTPFLRAQVDIKGNVTEAAVIVSAFDNAGFTLTLTDIPIAGTNTGTLVTDDGLPVGLVNYLNGNFSFTLTSGVIPSDANIYASVVPYQASRPTDVIFYNQQLTFRPVPQQIYQVEFQISQQPTQLIAANDAPELDEWYELLCAGAAKLIYADFPDPEGMQYIESVFQEQVLLAQRRTLKQLSTQRVKTIFSEPGRPYSGYFYGSQYSGGISG